MAYSTPVLSTLCLLISIAMAKGDDSQIRAQFLQEYGPHGEELMKKYSAVQFRRTNTRPHSENKLYVIRTEGKFKGENYVLRGSGSVVDPTLPQDDKALPIPQEVEARNRLYHFSLSTGKNGEYVLKRVTIFNEADHVDPIPISDMTAPYADYYRNLTFLAMVSDKGTEFLDFRDCIWQDKPAKELKVQYKEVDPTTMKESVLTSSYFFSPTDSWVCVGQRWPPRNLPKDSNFDEAVYSYDNSGVGAPVLKRMQAGLREPGKSSWSKVYWTTEILEYKTLPSIPEEEFRLSAFGLPEPVGIVWEKPNLRTPRYVWILIAAGACAILGVYFRWRARPKTVAPNISTKAP